MDDDGLRFGWSRFLILFTALIYPTFGALLPTATRGVTKYSPTLEAVVPNVSISCVSPTEEPDWAGPIDATDCTAALFTLTHEVSLYQDQYFTFWSKKFRPSVEPSMGWELPYGKAAGTCIALFRIAKDFGDDVLPLSYDGPHNYLKTSTREPTDQGRWDWLLRSLAALLPCVQGNGEPGWWTSPYGDGILMLLPSESAMARQWWYSAVGLSGMNSTTLNLVGTS